MYIRLDKDAFLWYIIKRSINCAAVAQLVEQLTRNEQVVRSSRISSSIKSPFLRAFLYVISCCVLGYLLKTYY